jgi:CheY-like chemotaxis protein
LMRTGSVAPDTQHPTPDTRPFTPDTRHPTPNTPPPTPHTLHPTPNTLHPTPDTHPPDVIVSDIGMPEEDGYELMRKVRALPPEQGPDSRHRQPGVTKTVGTRHWASPWSAPPRHPSAVAAPGTPVVGALVQAILGGLIALTFCSLSRLRTSDL